MAAYERILVEINDHVGTVTLNRPEKANAFDPDMCDDLLEALRMLASADQVRVIVITGAGKDIALTIRNAPQPVLAAVNGPAAGGGANLALACDYRIASDRASIGQVFHRLGLVPDWGGTYFLPRLVGTAKALELVWSARMVDAVEAQALGLFDRVVPHERLLDEARTQGELWAAQPRLAVRRAKEAIYGSEAGTLEGVLDLELAHQSELFATPEARARLGAALSKRS